MSQAGEFAQMQSPRTAILRPTLRRTSDIVHQKDEMQKEHSFRIGGRWHRSARGDRLIVMLKRTSYEFRTVFHAAVEKRDGTNGMTKRKKLLCRRDKDILIVLDVQFKSDGHWHDLPTDNSVK
jgi:hypothetical protein